MPRRIELDEDQLRDDVLRLELTDKQLAVKYNVSQCDAHANLAFVMTGCRLSYTCAVSVIAAHNVRCLLFIAASLC